MPYFESTTEACCNCAHAIEGEPHGWPDSELPHPKVRDFTLVGVVPVGFTRDKFRKEYLC
jgi:hypothetical protein